MKILFICKYNRFRSRVAEAYFKYKNKDEKIQVSSRGLIKGFLPLNQSQVECVRKMGFSIEGNPETLSMDYLAEQDRIIIVANDVPKEIFNYPTYKNKIEIWEIEDNQNTSGKEEINITIKKIMDKVDKLIQELK